MKICNLQLCNATLSGVRLDGEQFWTVRKFNVALMTAAREGFKLKKKGTTKTILFNGFSAIFKQLYFRSYWLVYDAILDKKCRFYFEKNT